MASSPFFAPARQSLARPARWTGLGVVLVFGLVSAVSAALTPREWTIDGVRREALVSTPETGAATTPAPIVFAFHGHGGNMRHAARSFQLHEAWPEAIVIYPQGLATATPLVDREGRYSGWQISPGAEGDRDLKFVDAMIESLRKDAAHPVDPKRIYATGHSNGGAFTYLLWSQRSQIFAAYGPVAATPGRGGRPTTAAPVIHVAGEKDTLVKFAWQEQTIRFVRRLNGCGDGAGSAWDVDTRCTLYSSEKGTGAPVVAWIHPGGHTYPAGASEVIVKFFQAHARP